jgi:hypothetical protein
MATVGRFGQRRRQTGGNMSSFIASLYREQLARDDQNIFDAYKNGGLFHGKPVTDQLIEKYTKTRRDTYTKDDPLYDQWNNTLIQTRFSIGEQKISLLYKQGKVGAGAVAAYYRGQLSKIPHDSAFYRDVAGRAAEWAKAGATAARGHARGRAHASLDAKLAKSQGDAALFDAATTAIETLARRAGLIFGTRATWADANANDLMGLLDHAGMTLPDGRKLTYGVWQGLALKRAAAFDSEIRIKDQAGRGTKMLRKARATFVGSTLGELNAIDDRGQYETLHSQFEQDVQAAKNDPARQLEITRDYLAGLKTLLGKAASATGVNENTPDLIGGLNNEIQSIETGKVVGPNAYDLFENRSTGISATRQGDMESTVESLFGDPTKGTLGAVQKNDGLQNGTMYYGQSKYGEPLDVHPLDTSTSSGIDLNQTRAIILVDGEPKSVVMAGKPIEGATYKSKDGTPFDPSKLSPEELAAAIFRGDVLKDNSKTIGYVYTNPETPTEHTYGVYNAQGSLTFTDDNPFTGSRSPDGTFVLDPDGSTTSIVNAADFSVAKGGQSATTGIAVSPDLTSEQLISVGHDLAAQGNQAAADVLINLGVSKQGNAHLQTILAANREDYGSAQQQLENRNAAEAADRLPNSNLVVGTQAYANGLTPNPILSKFGTGFMNPPKIDVQPPTPQPTIKPPPTIKVAAPPPPPKPQAIQQGKDTGDISYKPAPPPPPPVISTGASNGKIISGGKQLV